MIERPKIGVATIIVQKEGNKVLLGKRINSHENNTWCFPGGHLEKFESFYDCAKRELEEETGLVEGVDVVYGSKEPVAITNDFFKKEDKHYITIFLEAKQISEKNPEVKEPEKMYDWNYIDLDYASENYDLFLPVKNLIKQGYEVKNERKQ